MTPKSAAKTVRGAIRCIIALVAAGVVLIAPARSADVVLGGALSDDLRARLSGGSLLIEQTADDATPSAQEIVSAARADYQRLLALMYDAGYFAPVISIRVDGREASAIPPVNPPRTVQQVRITVEPGKRFLFGRASIAPLPQGARSPDEFATGQVASLSVLRDTVAEGVAAWRGDGYAKATLERQQITARHAEGQLDATLTLAPGERLRFGPLRVAGNTDVRSERIIDIAGLPQGRVFDPEEVARAANRLRRTGAFQSVAMLEDEGTGPDGTQIITAQLAEAKPRRFGFGAEVSTLEGLALSGFWLHRNLLGGAERLRFDAEIKGIGGDTGGVDGLIGVRFERPATFNEDTNFFALAEAEQRDEVAFFSRRVSVGVGIERFASEKRTYTFGLGVRRGLTRDTFGENDYTLFLVPLGLTFDYRDRALDARSGYYADVSFAPFLAISGAANGARSYADLRAYRSFGEARNITLALRGQIGSVVGPSLATAPADFLFYSGGGGTVRGHDYQSLGVDLGGGNVVGGRAFANFTAEMRWRSAGNLGVVGFFDAGYVGPEAFPDGSGEWHSGAGVGLRYATGIGPIRLDLAVPTSGASSGSAVQIYIGIGQSF